MRICYVGCYRDGTGYAYAAHNYIEALEKSGIEVVAIPFRFNKLNTEPSEIVKNSEKRKISGVELVIIHSLPQFFDPHTELPTIGVFSTEMSGIPKNWVEGCNKMHLNVVSSNQSKDACFNSGVLTPIQKLPYCFDISKYEKSYPEMEFVKKLKDEGKTIFYTIGEFINRKNISSLLRAYYTEFTNNDKVHLIIKTNLTGVKAKELGDVLNRKNYEIFSGLNLPKEQMPDVDFLPNYMDEEELLGLHYNCDIFVQTSYGESWSIPAWESMAFGKTPIVPASTGYLDWCSTNEGFLIKTTNSPCFGLIDSDPNLYNSSFDFYPVDINDLRNKMRFCLSHKDELKEKSIAGIEKSKLYSHENVGASFRKVLENVKKNCTKLGRT